MAESLLYVVATELSLYTSPGLTVFSPVRTDSLNLRSLGRLILTLPIVYLLRGSELAGVWLLSYSLIL